MIILVSGSKNCLGVGIKTGFFKDSSRMLQLHEFVWTLCSSVRVVFNNFLFIDATDRSKISSDQHR